MLRTRTHKLVLVHGIQTGELYDLAVEPTETTNHFNDPEYRDIKQDLLIQMADRMALTVDPLPLRGARC